AGPASDSPGGNGQPRWPATRLALLAGGGVLIAGALFSVWDYSRVTAIFQAKAGDPPLAQRIARGQRSVFFAHHADYAAVTSGVPTATPANADRAFDRVSHYLLDTRLMIAWAKSLAARGELDPARHLAARLREFNKADAEKFFESCPPAAVPAAPGLPFQCELPDVAQRWQNFVPAR
ncbi:MAG: polymerase, partial [Rubrivivax sp.]|nr:polymerase [Rubrivivax sp.]